MRNITVGTLNLSKTAKDYVNNVLNNNRLSYGEYSKKFENSFSSLHNCKYGILSNSGTSSLQVALQTLKKLHNWNDGDEVIVPAVTFVATANIVIHNNMVPIFVDIENEYYSIDVNLIEKAITKKTRAIIPVHLFGHPSDMDPIVELAKKYNLKVIEDSCETMFANYNGKPVGSIGDIGCFSTYVAHLLVTGVGGLSLTNNEEYAITMRSLVNHGRDSIYLSIDDDNNVSNEKLKTIISKRFNFIDVGHSFRVTEMEAALGVAQLETWESMINKRKSNAEFLTKNLNKHSFLQLPKVRKNSDHSFMMYPIVLKNGCKSSFVNFLEYNGIETRDMLPMTNQEVYKKLYNIKEEDYPVAKLINENGFYIGCHQDLTNEDLEYIIEVFDKL